MVEKSLTQEEEKVEKDWQYKGYRNSQEKRGV